MSNLFIYEQIKEYLTELIVANRNNPTYKLPSEQQVSQKFNASRVSVRKAFSMLEQDGVIYRIKGKGTFIQQEHDSVLLSAKENPSNCFVFIIPEVSSRFVQDICNGMLAASKELDRKLLILSSSNSTQLERDNISTAMRINCAGILLMPVDDNNYNDSILSLSLSKFPTIFIDRRLYGLNINCVSSDHSYIGYNATSYLLKHNREHILFLSLSRSISSVRQRLDGYENALNEHLKGTYRRYILNIEDYMTKPAELFNIIHNYLQANPQITGCIAGSGTPALYLVKALQSLGHKIGEDFEVVFLDDDSHDISELLDYNIPTIIQDGTEIGRTAVKMLYNFTLGKADMSDKTIPLFKFCDI
ncbi:MAG: substrate-binding domain-containing protein [Clostridia bacterium]|nr:substrate-binding domain-containing protein [Clostridia bacterium]